MKKQNLITFFMTIILGLTTSASFANSKSCPKGQFWDARVNRCMITMKNAEVKQESAACQGLTGDEFKECFNKNAQDKASEMEDDGDMQTHKNKFSKGNTTKILIPLTISLVSSYYLFLNKKKFEKCKSTSMWLMFGGGVAGFLGEMSAQLSYKKKTKNLADDYKEKMSDYKREGKYKIMTDNQTLAFDYLIEAEKARKSAEKIRRGAWVASASLYSAAALMATIEWIQVGSQFGAACAAAASYDLDKHIKSKYDSIATISPELSGYEYLDGMTSAEFIEIIARKVMSELSPIQLAYSEEEEGNENGLDVTAGIKSGVDYFKSVGGNIDLNLSKKKIAPLVKSKAGKSQMSALDKALATPYLRVAMNGLLALYARKIAKDAKENMDIAQNRIDALTKIRDDFVASGGAGLAMCKDDDWDNKEMPQCFCFKPEGGPDAKKRNLTICKDLVAKFDAKMAKKYGWKYGAMDNVKVCVDEKNQMDTFCKCKTKKSSTGKGDACTKISSKMNISGLGGNSWLKGLTAPADSLLNGNLDGSQLNTTDLNKRALAIKKNTTKLAKDPKHKDKFKKINSTRAKLEKAHSNWVKKSFPNGAPRGLASSLGRAAPLPTSAKDVLKAAKKDAQKASEVKYKDGKPLASGPGDKKGDNFDFDWGDDSTGKGGVEVDEIAKVMDKNYAIKGDINNNPSQDIFKILSMRYQRSGLRRLFDTEGKSIADEANGSDINEK